MALFGSDADYMVFEESDEDEDDESSSDENDEFLSILLNQCSSYTPQSKRSRVADEFEQEMNMELNKTMDSLHATNSFGGYRQAITTSNTGTKEDSNSQSDNKYYDDIYFDSDEEKEQDGDEGVKRKTTRRKHPVISDDDLFYDPTMDQADQDWIDKCRRRYTPRNPRRNRQQQSQTQQRLPNSDAVLNCPACMSTLCLDCQRHEIYKGQYRAMFVLNCKVDTGKMLKYPLNGKKKFKSNGTDTDKALDVEETYYPVYCSICNTEVAVQDTDEVYHFFNVLASFA